jgi:thymidylate synthase ThyX
VKVNLIEYTGSPDQWRAAEVLIWTKRTRIEMSPGGLEEIRAWDQERKLSELKYMAATIPSSWEFVDYTFLISGVTRAFTHQIVRTRTGSYAQQNQSVQKLDNWDYRTGPSIKDKGMQEDLYDNAMASIKLAYKQLVDKGAKVEDARGLLPTNIHSNIVVKWNLRTCCETFRKRASSERGHGEYHDVIGMMRDRIICVHPWAALFLDRSADVVARDAYEMIKKIGDKELRMNLSKAIDAIMTGGEV